MTLMISDWSEKRPYCMIQIQILIGCVSREQLRQKEDKRGRTREYQIVNHYSGKWLPLSQVKDDLVM